MIDDAELLRRYDQDNSEEAFAELVRRHINFVYATALRRLGGDTHQATDVAQTVFVKLARHAGSLSTRRVLAGWLHTASRNAAIDVVRAENRRRIREHDAMELKPDSTAAGEWEQLRPALDAALDGLAEADREAVLLRFFEGRRFGDIGALLGLSEDNARRRVDRALEKLRDQLAQRGITSTAAALALALANQPAVAAPAALAGEISGAALAGTWLSLAVMSKLQIGIVGAILVMSTVTGVVEVRANRALKTELAGLQAGKERQDPQNVEDNRLNTELETLGRQNPAAAELAHLRQRAALLRARPPWVSDGAWRPVNQARNAGWASTETALETVIWARATGNRKVLDLSPKAAPGKRPAPATGGGTACAE